MILYSSDNIKLPDPQLDKLKLTTKNAEKPTLAPSPNMISYNDDNTNFLNKLPLTDR